MEVLKAWKHIQFEAGGGTVTLNHRDKTVNFETPVDGKKLEYCFDELMLEWIAGSIDGRMASSPLYGIRPGWTILNPQNLQNCYITDCYNLVILGHAKPMRPIYVEGQRVNVDKYGRALLTDTYNMDAYFKVDAAFRDDRHITVTAINERDITEYDTQVYKTSTFCPVNVDTGPWIDADDFGKPEIEVEVTDPDLGKPVSAWDNIKVPICEFVSDEGKSKILYVEDFEEQGNGDNMVYNVKEAGTIYCQREHYKVTEGCTANLEKSELKYLERLQDMITRGAEPDCDCPYFESGGGCKLSAGSKCVVNRMADLDYYEDCIFYQAKIFDI